MGAPDESSITQALIDAVDHFQFGLVVRNRVTLAVLWCNEFARRLGVGAILPGEIAAALADATMRGVSAVHARIQQEVLRIRRVSLTDEVAELLLIHRVGDSDAGRFRNLADERGISRGEYSVLKFVQQGWGNRQIAEILGISESAAKKRLSRVMRKLGARGRSAASALASGCSPFRRNDGESGSEQG